METLLCGLTDCGVTVVDKKKSLIRVLASLYPLLKLSGGSPSQSFGPPIVVAHAPFFDRPFVTG